jgi:hypothetical protein
VGPYPEPGGYQCVGAMELDRPSGVALVRDEERAVPVATGLDGPRAPPAWSTLASSEHEGLVALMARLSLRAVRHAGEAQRGVSHAHAERQDS